MEKQKYIGITIGPIVDTLLKTKHTRELWAASFLFSDTIKDILKHIKVKYNEHIILPYSDDSINEINPINFGAGLYPDRIIIKSTNEKCFTDCETYIEKAKTSLVEKLKTEDGNNFSDETIKNFINDYFKIYTVELEVEEINSPDDDKAIPDKNNPIFAVNNALDVLELRSNTLFKNHRALKYGTDGRKKQYNPLEYFLDRVNNTKFKLENYSKEATNVGRYKHIYTADRDSLYNFPTVAEISTIPIQSQVAEINWNNLRENENDNESIIDKLKVELKAKDKLDVFKFRHKYYCIVQADGDNFGDIIRNLKNDNDRKQFSKIVFEFSKKAAQRLSEYGAKPIYVGGDDLLFLCPIVSIENDKQISLFDLIASIDDLFDASFQPLIDSCKEPKPKLSISYGITVHYVKYPLNEALDKAFDMLKYKAKKVEGKNAIAFYLQKHSGQFFELKLSKNKLSDKAFQTLKTIINEQLEKPQMLNTMIFKIREAELLLESALTDKTTPNRLDGFFENFFNEPIHKTIDNKKYIQNIKQLLIDIYFDHQQIFKHTDGVLDQFYNALRIIHFIQQEDSND